RHKIFVNGNPVFFRLDINNISFPLTGYPPMDEASWEKLFRIYKSYGFNGMRCHSWCPPEAAFDAADKLGMYIEAELVWPWAWKTEKTGTKAEWIAKGYTDGLGSNPSADIFVPEEMHWVVNTYGNHPSFAFFCIGNELGGSDFTIMEKWIKEIKNIDHRRLYAVSTARTITEADDYNITHNIPGVGGTYGVDYNNTLSDHDKNYKRAKIPIIAHEIGQYLVYPVWKNLKKYTGVLRPWDMLDYEKMAKENEIYNWDSAYRQASGALQQLLYKSEFEDLYRTGYCAGYCVLDMEDYTGQGAALVGWLNDFYDSKGITTPQNVRMYNNDVVLLLRTKSFVFTSEDTLHASLQIANYSNKDLRGNLHWEIKDQNGKIILKKTGRNIAAIHGRLTEIGSIDYLWKNAGNQAKEYTISLVFGEKLYSNEWNFFVYPHEKPVEPGNILIANEWTKRVDEELASGGKVLLLAHNLGTTKTSHPISFDPVFWSLGFFPQQEEQTLGSLIENKNLLFKNFPTSYYTDWQWYTISKGKYFYLKSFPRGYHSIVEPVPDFHNNERLGSLFEGKVSNGKLLVCGYDLTDSSNIVGKQLMYSILEYMKSDAFHPAYSLQADSLKDILIKVTP
ncbi:MAG TPA: glycoside hydrolase family 2 TIM barrel-domain containing protein, partial [Hanamia sp.]